VGKFLCVKEAPMKIRKELCRKEYLSKFGSKDPCLADTKWGVEYCCRKCKNKRFIAGKKESNRRCSRFGYDEFPTSHALIRKIKLGIENRFDVACDIATSKKSTSSIWLSERSVVKHATASLFRRKVQDAMNSSEQFPLEDEVHVDEFEIGTPQKGEQSRSKSKKKIRIVIALS
jgi:hypothetical protein